MYTGGGPRVVVSTAAFHATSSGFGSRSRRFERNKNVSSPSTCESQYCGEPPWPRCSVLGLRPPGLEFRILCLDRTVSSQSSHHPQEVLLAQFSLYVHKARFISFRCTQIVTPSKNRNRYSYNTPYTREIILVQFSHNLYVQKSVRIPQSLIYPLPIFTPPLPLWYILSTHFWNNFYSILYIN